MTGKIQGGDPISLTQSEGIKPQVMQQERMQSGHNFTTPPKVALKLTQISRVPINKFGQQTMEITQQKLLLDPKTKVTSRKEANSDKMQKSSEKTATVFKKKQPTHTTQVKNYSAAEKEKLLLEDVLSKLEKGKETGKLSLSSEEKTALKNLMKAHSMRTDRMMNAIDTLKKLGSVDPDNKGLIHNMEVIVGDLIRNTISPTTETAPTEKTQTPKEPVNAEGDPLKEARGKLDRFVGKKGAFPLSQDELKILYSNQKNGKAGYIGVRGNPDAKGSVQIHYVRISVGPKGEMQAEYLRTSEEKAKINAKPMQMVKSPQTAKSSVLENTAFKILDFFANILDKLPPLPSFDQFIRF